LVSNFGESGLKQDRCREGKEIRLEIITTYLLAGPIDFFTRLDEDTWLKNLLKAS